MTLVSYAIVIFGIVPASNSDGKISEPIEFVASDTGNKTRLRNDLLAYEGMHSRGRSSAVTTRLNEVFSTNRM